MAMPDGLNLESLCQRPVLVLEDNPGAQTAIRLALRRSGIENLHLAETVAEAKALIEADPDQFVAAILDARLPDGSGLEVATLLAECNPTCGLIVLTARWDDAVVNEALAIPVHAFGHKPFDIEGPAGLVRRAIERARGVDLAQSDRGAGDFTSVAGGLPRVLTVKQRYIVAMRLADRSYADIGEVLEIAVETVRSHLKHARTRLQATPGEDLAVAVQNAANREFGSADANR